MRNLLEPEIDRCRVRTGKVVEFYGDIGDETCGVFIVRSIIDRAPMTVIAASGLGWDHVSVARQKRVPNWYEMEQVKRLFFKAEETAVQFHVPSEQHISLHPNCLHLWRPNDGGEIPLPPNITI